MHGEVKRLFIEAEGKRTEESRKLSLKELCDTMAMKAGWHTVYVPNNRSKVKDRVKYTGQFDDCLFSELLCRFKDKIYQQFMLTNSIRHQGATFKIYDCVLRFMGTYKPHLVERDNQIVSRMLLSIRQRAIECNFEEDTRYNLDSTRVYVTDQSGQLVGFKVLHQKGRGFDYVPCDGYTEEDVKKAAEISGVRDPDRVCHIEVSLSSEIKVGKNGETRTLADTIPDNSAVNSMDYKLDLEDLKDRYAETDHQRLLIDILVSSDRMMKPAALLREFMEETKLDAKVAKKVVYEFFGFLKEALAR